MRAPWMALAALLVTGGAAGQAPPPLDTPLPTLPDAYIDKDSRAVAENRRAGKPPCKVGAHIGYYGGSTITGWNAQDGLFEVVTDRDKDKWWLKPAMLSIAGCAALDPQPVTARWFVGSWDLRIGGEAVWKKKGPGNNDWRIGMADLTKLPPLTIKADGTYAWVLSKTQMVKGRWRVARPEEMLRSVDNTQVGVTLEQGDDGVDWAVMRDFETIDKQGPAGVLIQRRNPALYYRAYRMP